MTDQKTKPGLLERLNKGAVICAEGYLFELERRGYVQAGAFVPEAVLDHPEAVIALHRDFLRAGSDVIEAFTYYGHREKLRLIGKEDKLESLQRDALTLAKKCGGRSRRSRQRAAARGRQHLQHQCLGSFRSCLRPRGPRHV